MRIGRKRIVVANKSRFTVFCVSVVLFCMMAGYMAGAAITVQNVTAKTDIVYYAPRHFAAQRSK